MNGFAERQFARGAWVRSAPIVRSSVPVPSVLKKLLVTGFALSMTLGGAPAAAAQPMAGSTIGPIEVARPFDIPIWQLPGLPYPLVWEFHLPPAPVPQYGDPCDVSQLYEVYDRRLVCIYAGAPSPWWAFVASEALNPDGTLNRAYPAG